MEDSINFENSEAGKQYKEFAKVLRQRSEKIKEYAEEMLRLFRRPLSEKDKLLQKLENVRKVAIELTIPKFGGKQFFSKK